MLPTCPQPSILLEKLHTLTLGAEPFLPLLGLEENDPDQHVFLAFLTVRVNQICFALIAVQ